METRSNGLARAWRPLVRLLVVAGGIAAAVVAGRSVFSKYLHGTWPEWTGFGPIDPPVQEHHQHVEAKTLWDWLHLLVVPGALAGVAYWLQESSKVRQQKLETARQQDSAILAYFDKMTDLLVTKRPTDEAEDSFGATVRSRTLAVLKTIDGARRGQVLAFLQESNLIRGSEPRVRLRGAQLDGADLRGLDLEGVNLEGAFLRGADLSETMLHGAILRDAVLDGARLFRASFYRPELSDEEAEMLPPKKRVGLAAHNISRALHDGTEVMRAIDREWEYVEARGRRKSAVDRKREASRHLEQWIEDGLSPGDLALREVLSSPSGQDVERAKRERDISGRAVSPEADELRKKIKKYETEIESATEALDRCVRADLHGTSLQKADLRLSDLRRAVLKDADLRGANLSSSLLMRADLRGATLTKASLKNTVLTNADISERQLKSAANTSGAWRGDPRARTAPAAAV